jgi:hypothetical protein
MGGSNGKGGVLQAPVAAPSDQGMLEQMVERESLAA